MLETLATLLASGDHDDYQVAMDICEEQGWAVDVPYIGETWFAVQCSGYRSRYLDSHSGVATEEPGTRTMRSRITMGTRDAREIASQPDWREMYRHSWSNLGYGRRVVTYNPNSIQITFNNVQIQGVIDGSFVGAEAESATE